MNGSLVFVLLLVTIVMVSQIVRTWLQQRDKTPKGQEELEDTLRKMEQLEERVRVLERIITENRFDLKKEIDSL
jgi:membrane protein implicated in regulation of membrane protease activity